MNPGSVATLLAVVLALLQCASAGETYGSGFLQVTRTWRRAFNHVHAYCSPRAAAINHDTTLDIVFCHGGEEPYQVGGIYSGTKGLDGKNGSSLWEFDVHLSPLGLDCHLDMDGDGEPDTCFIAGRNGVMRLFHIKTGQTVWDAGYGPERNVAVRNHYRPLPVGDWDNDGVLDFVLAQGGTNGPTRPSASLRLMSGGRPGINIAEMRSPDSQETYFPPVMYTRKDGMEWLVLGTGGETKPGALYRIPMWAFASGSKAIRERHLELLSLPDPCWPSRGSSVAPVLVDLNGDHVPEIVMSHYSGRVVALDGETGKLLWEVPVSQCWEPWETYSSPSAAQFNEDGIPDIFVQFTRGIWMMYDAVWQAILDGKTGGVLYEWRGRFQNQMVPLMTSSLAIQRNGVGNDIFVFYRLTPDIQKETVDHTIIHGGEIVDDSPLNPNEGRVEEQVLMRKKNWHQAMVSTGNVELELRAIRRAPIAGNNGTVVEETVLFRRNYERRATYFEAVASTPLIEDLDGDGFLDITVVLPGLPEEGDKKLNVDEGFDSSVNVLSYSTNIPLERPQTWGGYIGTDGDALFDTPDHRVPAKCFVPLTLPEDERQDAVTSGSVTATLEWRQSLVETVTTSSPQLVRGRTSKLLDIAFAYGLSFGKNDGGPESGMMVLRGDSGEEKWRSETHVGMTSINCQVKMNGTTHVCVGGGYEGILRAVNVREGVSEYDSDASATHGSGVRDVSHILMVPDQNDDGIADAVSLHGGVESSQLGSAPIVRLVSGADFATVLGAIKLSAQEALLGDAVLLRRKDSYFIVFGTGSMERHGKLYAMSLSKLRETGLVKDKKERAKIGRQSMRVLEDPTESTKASDLESSSKKKCTRKSSGFHTTPTLVDLNDDGTADVVIAGAGGFIYAVDGASGKRLWLSRFRGCQPWRASASATPGFYNDDKVPDLFVSFVLPGEQSVFEEEGGDGDFYDPGALPERVVYTIVDGVTGDPLWVSTHSYPTPAPHIYMPATSVRMPGYGQDVFLFVQVNSEHPTKLSKKLPYSHLVRRDVSLAIMAVRRNASAPATNLRSADLSSLFSLVYDNAIIDEMESVVSSLAIGDADGNGQLDVFAVLPRQPVHGDILRSRRDGRDLSVEVRRYSLNLPALCAQPWPSYLGRYSNGVYVPEECPAGKDGN